MTPDVQWLAAALLDALGLKVPFGQVTLNMNESQLESVETKVKFKVHSESRWKTQEKLDSAKRGAVTLTR